MIDIKSELNKFPSINLDSIARIDSNISDDVRTSILLYNSALQNLKSDSEDIAIIELKKAVSLNPEFYEAINLLGLCYYYMKEYEKSEEMFEKVVKAENNGVRAFNYLRVIRGGEEKTGDIAEKKKVKKKKSTVKRVESSRDDRHQGDTRPDMTSIRGFSYTGRGKSNKKNDIIKYLAGIVAGLVIAFIIGIPGIFGPWDDAGENTGDMEIETVVVEKNEYEEYKEYKEKYTRLENEHENLKKELDTVKVERDYYKAVIKLFEIEALANARKYEEAADMLASFKGVQFTGAEKEKYDNLFNNIMPRVSDALYSEAYNLFQAGKYAESLEKYTKITEYYENYGRMDVVLYYMGKCYLELGDNENARTMFLKTIEKFPDSEYAGYSRSRLEAL
ncbi:MAG: tetratricopeptide repeat protein [Clostridiaceae bacterium]|nr:tetratricopeptide repeat protein [Clostridiaceae bacterium]